MPAPKRTPWLICYDVADPRRLRDVHKEVRRYATPFQRSVFRIYATRSAVAHRLHLLERVIDPQLDDVRGYPLLTTVQPVIYGRQMLGEGIWFDWQRTLFEN